MISIDLSENILFAHAKYIIASDMKSNLQNLKNDPSVNVDIMSEHNQFCNYFINQIENLKTIDKEDFNSNIFLQTPENLDSSIGFMKEKFSKVSEQLKADKKYSQLVLDKFGYAQFTSSGMVQNKYDEEKIFFESMTKKAIREALSDIKGGKEARYREKHYKVLIKGLENSSNKYHKKNINTDIGKVFFRLTRYLSRIDTTKFRNCDEFITNLKLAGEGYSRLLNKKINEEATNIYNYISNGVWSAYDYIMSLRLKTCPYCNRNYITPIYSSNGKMRADLDHFFPKAVFPYMSMSIYNLVPACKFCNSSLKGEKEFRLSNNISPFEKNITDNYRFTYYPKSYESFFGKDDIKVAIEYNINRYNISDVMRLKKNNIIFNIENTYVYHKDIINDLVQKRYMHDNSYINYLYKNFEGLFNNEEELLMMILGNYYYRNKFDGPLAKLINDIIEELNFKV